MNTEAGRPQPDGGGGRAKARLRPPGRYGT